MTRKDYIAVARIIADQREKALDTTTGPSCAEGWAVLEATRDMAVQMADHFRADNSRFDRGRFYAACGIADVNRATGGVD